MPDSCYVCGRSRRARRSCQQRWPTWTVWWKIWTPSPSRTLRCSHPACHRISHLSSCHLHLNSLILDSQLNYGPLYNREKVVCRFCCEDEDRSQSWKELLCGPIVIRIWSGEKQYCQQLEGCPSVCDCAEYELMRIGELRLQGFKHWTIDLWPVWQVICRGRLYIACELQAALRCHTEQFFFIYFICISLNRVYLWLAVSF